MNETPIFFDKFQTALYITYAEESALQLQVIITLNTQIIYPLKRNRYSNHHLYAYLQNTDKS